MSDFILKTGDVVTFSPTFGVATVFVVPGTIGGSSRMKIDGALACVTGDEASVVVAGVQYIAPGFPIPGVGKLTISALGLDQNATRTKSAQKATLLKGSSFTASLTVSSPASITTAAGTTFDPVTAYSGNGQFISTNVRCKGT